MTVSHAKRARVWDLSGSTISGVLSTFRIDPSSSEVVAPLVSGTGRTQGFRVRVGDRDWALKQYTSSAVVERLRTSHDLQLRLDVAGFPVAPLRTSGDGETVVRYGPAWYTLHQWVDGQQVSIADRDALVMSRPHLIGELAAMIARLHMISSQGTDEGGDPDVDRLPRVPHANVRRIRGPRRRIVSPWQMMRMKPRKSDFDRWVLRVFPEVVARAETLAQESIAHRVPQSGTGLIHNDVNWENLILDEGFHVRALLDFDNAVRAPWVLEVGACAVVLVGSDPSTVDQFVSSYEETTGAALDRDLVRLGMELKCVRSITTSVLSYLDGAADARLLAPWCHHLYQSFELMQRQ